MKDLTQKEKNKLLAAAEIVENGDMAVIKKLLEFQDFVDENKETVEALVERADDTFANIRQGKDGSDGKDGVDGRDGKDGADGSDGKDGKDGKDGSEISGEEIANKINDLPIEEAYQIGIEHIKGLNNEIKRIEKVASTYRGGGTSSAGVAFAFKSIAHTEQPSGLINGSNTTYTVQNNIWWIFGFTLNGEQIAELPNFTYINKTITFATALPAAYSGKDFEVKYIGT